MNPSFSTSRPFPSSFRGREFFFLEMGDREKMDYIISMTDEDGEEEQYSFPDTANMYAFLHLLTEDGHEIDNIILPEAGYV